MRIRNQLLCESGAKEEEIVEEEEKLFQERINIDNPLKKLRKACTVFVF
jgi:hypothetical protein